MNKYLWNILIPPVDNFQKSFHFQQPLLQAENNNLTRNSGDYSTVQTHFHYQNVTETTNVSRRGSFSHSPSEQKEIAKAFGANNEASNERNPWTKHYENLSTQNNLSPNLTRTNTKDEKETIFSTDNSASALILQQKDDQSVEEIVDQKGKKLYKVNGHIFQPMRFHWVSFSFNDIQILSNFVLL